MTVIRSASAFPARKNGASASTPFPGLDGTHTAPHVQKTPIPGRLKQREPPVTTYRKTEDAIKALTPEQYRVTQLNGTEYPGTGAHLHTKDPGLYVDVVTGEPLFLSADKYESGCGWPAFVCPVTPAAVREVVDTSHGMVRTEVRSTFGDSHLGHVFHDGPQDRGGLRYCINSAALRFIPRDRMAKEGYGAYLDALEDVE